MPAWLSIMTAALLGIQPVSVYSTQQSLRHVDAPVFGSDGQCSSVYMMESLLQQTKLVVACGEGEWTEVANLDMSNTSQTCPRHWSETTYDASDDSIRVCNGECSNGAIYTSPICYSRVCGRVTGAATGSPDAFDRVDSDTVGNINATYLDGVSITYGTNPRKPIWSLGANYRDEDGNLKSCPCDATINTTTAPITYPPSFVGNNYFCDGDQNGLLWDGLNCATACCTFNNPPWFSVTLPNPTMDDIEVRICIDEPTFFTDNEEVYVQKLQLLVQ